MGEVNTEPHRGASFTCPNSNPLSLSYQLAWLRHLALRYRYMGLTPGALKYFNTGTSRRVNDETYHGFEFGVNDISLGGFVVMMSITSSASPRE